MTQLRCVVLLLIAGLMTPGLVDVARAADPAPKVRRSAPVSVATGVEKMFAAAAKSTPPAVTSARAQYDALKKRHPSEPRIDYAFALALCNQHRYKEALPLVARYAAAMPTDLDAARVHIWLLIEQRNYRGALDEAERVAQQIVKLRDADARHPWTVYLGTVYGYFELARPEAVKAEQLVVRKQQVLELLGSDQLAVLDEGRQVVSERLAELQTERREKLDQTLAEVDQKQGKAKTAIEGETRRIEVNEQLADSSKEQLREAQRELGVIQLQLSSLETDRMRVGTQIGVVQSQILAIQQELQTSQVVDRRRPGVTESTTARSTAIFEPRLIPLNTTFAALNKQAFDMDRRLLALRTRAAELSGKSGDEATTLDESSAAIRNAEKRTRALEKQVKQLERKAPAAKSAITAEMTRFGTYLPFPFEEESQRVLGWFAN